MWEILHGTIKKMTKQVNQLQSEVDDARDRLDAAKRKVSSGLFVFLGLKFYFIYYYYFIVEVLLVEIIDGQ